MAQRVKVHTVDSDEAGQRVDNFLFRVLKGVPKSRIYKAIRSGEVRINKKRVKPVIKLQVNDVVRIPPLTVKEEVQVFVKDKLKSQILSSILFENEELLVLNKPSGIAVHGGSGVALGLIEALRAIKPECKKLALVHRIDKDTSGCIMVAKNHQVLTNLHAQLREKTIQKTYLALALGKWPARKAQVKAPLEKYTLASGERMVKVSSAGKPSLTLTTIKQVLQDFTLLEASPVTGRTHQIRVHCQFEGFPLAGDPKYCTDNQLKAVAEYGLERLFLHAYRVEFFSPLLKKRIKVTAPLPDDLSAFLAGLS